MMSRTRKYSNTPVAEYWNPLFSSESQPYARGFNEPQIWWRMRRQYALTAWCGLASSLYWFPIDFTSIHWEIKHTVARRILHKSQLISLIVTVSIVELIDGTLHVSHVSTCPATQAVAAGEFISVRGVTGRSIISDRGGVGVARRWPLNTVQCAYYRLISKVVHSFATN